MRNILCCILFSILCQSCHRKTHSNSEIELAMIHYDSLLKKMNVDSIALLFMPNGSLGPSVKGRDSIRHLLAGMTNLRLLAISTTSDSIYLEKDSAFQQGKFEQTVLIQQKDTVHVKGTYRARWIWIPKQGWRIKSMDTETAL